MSGTIIGMNFSAQRMVLSQMQGFAMCTRAKMGKPQNRVMSKGSDR